MKYDKYTDVYCKDCKHRVDWLMTFFGLLDRTCYPILWHYAPLDEKDSKYFDEKIQRYGPHTWQFNIEYDCHYFEPKRRKRKEYEVRTH